MPVNFYMYFITALIPLIVGSIYYSPMLAGNAWMEENNFTKEDLEGGNMVKILSLAYLCGIFISFSLTGIVIHQYGAFSMMMPEVMESGSSAMNTFNGLMTEFGGNFRTFGHGALHGVITALLFVFPIIATNSLFERKSWRYNLIHVGYWLITLALVGGVLCATLDFGTLS